MKISKLGILVSMAMAMMALAACGSDEPAQESDDSHVTFPTLDDGHRLMSEVKRTYNTGATQALSATYDSRDHLKGMTLVVKDPKGNTMMTEALTIDYGAGLMTHKINGSTTQYEFVMDNRGRITRITKPSNLALTTYTYDGDVLTATAAQDISLAYTYDGNNLARYNVKKAAQVEQTLTYGNDLPNVASVDVLGMGRTPFSALMTMVMRSAGLFGKLSQQLPTQITTVKTIEGSDEKPKLVDHITYSLDANNLVTGYSAREMNVDDNVANAYTIEFRYKN